MIENFNSLSSEDIRKLGEALVEARDLTARQEEIIKKVLEGEKEIGELRIAYLNRFGDTFSKILDNVVAKKTSKMSDAFHILEKRAENSFKEARTELEKFESSKPSSHIAKSKKVNQVATDEKIDALGGEARTSENIAARLEAFLQNFHTTEEQLNAIAEHSSQLEATRIERRNRATEELAKREENLEKTLTELSLARSQTEEDILAQRQLTRISHIQAAGDAEVAVQNRINEIMAERAFALEGTITDELGNDLGYNTAGIARATLVEAHTKDKVITKIEEARKAYIAKHELELARENNGVLSKEAASRIQKEAAEKFKIDKKNLEKLNKMQVDLDYARDRAKARQKLLNDLDTLTTAETFEERKQAFHDLTHDANGDVNISKAISTAVLAVSNFAAKLENTMDEIGSFKGFIDTRLQGSSNETTVFGSYWDQIVKDITGISAVTPFFKQSDFSANVKSLVERGIAFDLEQRAFLMTIQDKIANTFNVADGTLLRLIRIQQEDSTAGRLGMESALNAFLNNMYETSEYLTDVANSVRGSLEEMQALMSGAEAAEVEYQVQKWLGSLYSVGMSQSAVNSISQALGQIAAGEIEGLTNSGAGNLLIMAANDAGLSIADILTDGLDSTDTNKLLQAAVNYLAELADSSKDNKVVQQQLANVFGVKASDLRAATNLVLPGSTNDIYESSLTYGNMLSQLYMMADSMGTRTSVAELMSNVWDNFKYTIAGSVASNPITYFIYKAASALEDATGGISIPTVSVMGNMVDLDTTIADLMRAGSIGGGILTSLGYLTSGLKSSFSGQAMLSKLGISEGGGLPVLSRNGEISAIETPMVGGGNKTLSEAYYAGNASESDIKSATLREADDTKERLMVEAKEQEEASDVTMINATVVKIYELLNDVTQGKSSFRVQVEGYGLTRAGSSGSSSGAQGGVAALNSVNGGNNTSISGSVNSGGIGSNVDLGGWVMI